MTPSRGIFSPPTKTGCSSLFHGGGLERGGSELTAAAEEESRPPSTALARVRLRDLEELGVETNLGFRFEKIGGFGLVNLKGGLREQVADKAPVGAWLRISMALQSFRLPPTTGFPNTQGLYTPRALHVLPNLSPSLFFYRWNWPKKPAMMQRTEQS